MWSCSRACVARFLKQQSLLKSFGQSSADFGTEFERFMDLPLGEQVKILPRF